MHILLIGEVFDDIVDRALIITAMLFPINAYFHIGVIR